MRMQGIGCASSLRTWNLGLLFFWVKGLYSVSTLSMTTRFDLAIPPVMYRDDESRTGLV